MTASAWDLLRTGNKDEAYRQLRESYLQKPTPSHIMELGVAYLWMGDYHAAWEHFQCVNQDNPKHADVYYAKAGTAQWCLNEPRAAVKTWRDGLDCQYADAAGGITLPLLLFFASVVRPQVISAKETEELLSSRAKDPRVQNWPGPLARFVLGQIDEGHLRNYCAGSNDIDTETSLLRGDFYVGVVEYSRANVTRFMDMMRKAADISWRDCELHRKVFFSRLWSNELFLARHEIAGL